MTTRSGLEPVATQGSAMLPQFQKIIDISLELDPKNFGMRTPAGFKKDIVISQYQRINAADGK
jgi:hypothetical protein